MRRLLPLALVLALSACSATAPSAPGPTPSSATGPATAGAGPDALTKMICEDEVHTELAGFLGVDTVEPPRPTWVPPVFTCVYAYADGRFTMTVWEQPDKAATEAYFKSKSDGGTVLRGLGEAAATLPDGSVVLRKDTKVLLVDVSTLPKQFGQPPSDPAHAALTIAQVVMHCWIETAPSPL